MATVCRGRLRTSVIASAVTVPVLGLPTVAASLAEHQL